MKKPTVPKLKKKLWKLVSKYVRLKSADDEGNVVCVTCKKKLPWKEAQAGHFIQGRMNAILFELRGIHCQCVGCNIFKHGNLLEYTLYMQRSYGMTIVDELIAQSKQIKQFATYELLDMINVYTIMVKELEAK